MNFNRPKRQQPTGVLRYSCGILFALFTFCYLYFLEGEVLAEAQYVFSKGVTTYSILIGAGIITLVLALLQKLVAFVSRLPEKLHALSYIPSALALAILTDTDEHVMNDFSFGIWLWLAPLVLVIYTIVVIAVRVMDIDFKSEQDEGLQSILYPNYIILFALILSAGSVAHTSDVYHFELKAERLILEGDYEGASQVGINSLRTSPRLSQLRMYALSKQGLLAEKIFEYPQYDGALGLLDVGDTIGHYRFSNEGICFHIGALCGKSVKGTERYLHLMTTDSLRTQTAIDYQLCRLLLKKDLNAFQHQLPMYYNLSDTLPGCYDSLPKAYKEALLIIGDKESAMQGILRIGGDSITTFADTTLANRYKDYNYMKSTNTDMLEKINRTHRTYGNTFWWYYEFSDKAVGDLRVKN